MNGTFVEKIKVTDQWESGGEQFRLVDRDAGPRELQIERDGLWVAESPQYVHGVLCARIEFLANSVNECAGKFGREAVAAAGGAEGDAFRRKLAEYDARVLKGRVGSVEFERPMLGLKPRRVADDERLAEVLDAMARYVKEGKAVPGEWREELEELLALRGSRFSKQSPWETFPEPAKPNVPQSDAESSKPTSTGLLVGPAGCGTCVSGWDEGISSGMVLCARRSVRNGRFYICGDYNRMSYAELDERMDRKFCGEQVKPNAPRTEADCT